MNKLLPVLVLTLAIQPALAAPVDIIGGPDGTVQTISHCGYLPVRGGQYTETPITIRIVQQKLASLGFNTGVIDGVYGKQSKHAVRAFQMEYGLSPDGVVGPATVQQLAYATHPYGNVRKCTRIADARF